MSGKMLKQNAVRSQNVKLKCREFSTLQKHKIKMQRKKSVLQYLFWEIENLRLLKNALFTGQMASS